LEVKLNKYAKSYILLVGVAGLIIGLDQWTKALVRTKLPFGEAWSPWPSLASFFRIVHWNNSGAAFGMFQAYGIIFTVLAIGITLAIVYYFPRVPPEDWILRIAMCFQLGGALGNLIDRIVLGRVTDFISVGSFAVFNLADASISVGVFILIIGLWLKDRQQKKEIVPE
jgi:signal peptidase II